MLLHKKPSTRRCLALAEKYICSSAGYKLSSQHDCTTVDVLSQEFFAKGGQVMWIFRAWITTKDGERIYAKDRGKKAFRFWIGPGPEPAKKN